MTTAVALLRALSEGQDGDAWEHAQALAKTIVDDPRNVLARAVLDAGPFAMRKAEELAEMVIANQAGDCDPAASAEQD